MDKSGSYDAELIKVGIYGYVESHTHALSLFLSLPLTHNTHHIHTVYFHLKSLFFKEKTINRFIASFLPGEFFSRASTFKVLGDLMSFVFTFSREFFSCFKIDLTPNRKSQRNDSFKWWPKVIPLISFLISRWK